MKSAQQSEVLIYAVGLLSEEERREANRARKALETLAEATGGAAYFPKELAEVDRIAHQVARDIRNQYTLVYAPSNVAMDSTFRQIKVSAKAREILWSELVAAITPLPIRPFRRQKRYLRNNGIVLVAICLEGAWRATSFLGLAVLSMVLTGSLKADLKRALAENNLERSALGWRWNTLPQRTSVPARPMNAEMSHRWPLLPTKLESVKLAHTSLTATGKDPQPEWFKRAEIATRDLLRKLESFQQAMSFSDRSLWARRRHWFSTCTKTYYSD